MLRLAAPYLGVGRVGDGVCRWEVCSIAAVIQNIGQTGALPGPHERESFTPTLQGGGGLGLAAGGGVGPCASLTHAPQVHLKEGGAEWGEGVVEPLLVELRGGEVDDVGEGGGAADLLQGVKGLEVKRVTVAFQLAVATTTSVICSAEEHLRKGGEGLRDVLLMVSCMVVVVVVLLLLLLVPGALIVQQGVRLDIFHDQALVPG